jgi:hypothetical protein
MPINVSSSAGTTVISGSTTTSSGSSGSTTYGGTGMSGSSGSTLSGAAWPSYSGTGSYPPPAAAGATMVVSGSDCYDMYVNLPISGAANWVYVTGSC